MKKPKSFLKVQSNRQLKQPVILKQPKIAGTTPLIVSKNPFPWTPVLRIILIALIAFGLVWALNSPIFLVRTIVVDGLNSVSKDSIIKLIPLQSNLWLFPTSQVEQKIKQSSPLVSDVAIYKGIPDTIRIVIAERVQAADWETGGKHYTLGLDGKIITSTSPTNSKLRIVDLTGINPDVGSIVVTPGFVQFIIGVQNSFELSLGVPLDHLEIGDTTFDVTAIPKSGPKILLDSQRAPGVQLTAAKLVIDKFKDRIKQYVDVRVPERAYFQ